MIHCRRRIWNAACALACMACLPTGELPQALAAGTETSRHADDLKLTVDSRWAGGAYGGYYPIRIRLTNVGPSRALLFRFRESGGAGGSGLPTVQRIISSAQNATEQFSLSIPLVGTATSGMLEVLDRGRPLDKLFVAITLPEAHRGGTDRPALLVISPTHVDCDQFEIAATSVSMGLVTGSGIVYRGSRSHMARANDHEIVSSGMLPESWIDYTGLDIVALSLATLDRLSPGVRGALVKWTEAGGTLLVYDVGRAAAESKDLSRLLDLSNREATSRAWQVALPAGHKEIVVFDENGDVAAPGVSTPVPAALPPGSVAPEVQPVPAPIAEANKKRWSSAEQTFAGRDLMLGRVYAFAGNPFPGAAIDWAWWLNTVKSGHWSWAARTGISSRDGNSEFFHFPIPGVAGVPVFAFLLLISIFTIVIGPLNYFLLWRRKQLFLLVLTIPVIAAVTSGSLFGYAVVADGFGVQSRLRSFTLLNQRTRTAISVNRIALYAGLVPSAGLSFSPDTAVYPIWADETAFESGHVDWTQTQHLSSGWLRSRTIAQFETISHRVERARVEVQPAAADADQLSISNGFEWEIATLLVKDDAGRLYFGKDIPAGSSVALVKATPAELSRFGTLLEEDEHKLQPPAGADQSAMGSLFSFDLRAARRYAMSGGDSTPHLFAESLMEQNLARMKKPADKAAVGGLPARSYLATFDENPGIEVGIERSKAKSGLHVLLGTY